MKKYLSPVMTVSAAVGLLLLLVVIATGAAYPDPLFQIGTNLGMGLIFLSFLLLAIRWVMDIRQAVKVRQPARILWLLAGAAAVLFSFLRR